MGRVRVRIRVRFRVRVRVMVAVAYSKLRPPTGTRALRLGLGFELGFK